MLNGACLLSQHLGSWGGRSPWVWDQLGYSELKASLNYIAILCLKNRNSNKKFKLFRKTILYLYEMFSWIWVLLVPSKPHHINRNSYFVKWLFLHFYKLFFKLFSPLCDFKAPITSFFCFSQLSFSKEIVSCCFPACPQSLDSSYNSCLNLPRTWECRHEPVLWLSLHS